MKRKGSPAPLWSAATGTIIRIVEFAHKGRGLLLLAMATSSFPQMTLTGRVLMPDSSAVAFANVTLLGEKQQTTVSGRFSYEISEAVQKKLGVEIGDDLPILVEKEGLVLLQPANGRVRIPRAAMNHYKESLRKSEDAIKRGLAALDDANEAKEAAIRKENLQEAKSNFHEAIHKDETASRAGREAEQRLPESYYNLGLAYLNEALYDSAAFFFAKADSAEPNNAEKLNWLGRAFKELAQYDRALQVYQRAFALDTTAYGRNHPNVAIRLNNIAAVLDDQGDYASALKKYNEALKIWESAFGRDHSQDAIALNNIGEVLRSQGDYAGTLENYIEALAIYLGPEYPNTKTVQENRSQARWASLGESERWRLQTQFRLSQLHNDSLSASDKLQLLNGIGVGYIKQAKPDSALIYLQQALPLAQRLNEQETLGTIYNNLGAAYKLKQDWPQAVLWLEKSVSHNLRVQGDSASVLAYTYFHLAGVAHAQGQPARAREYAQKSLALAERHKLAELRKEVAALLREMEK